MAKTSSPFPFPLRPRPRGAPAARWLYDVLREAILEGRLALGARLPTTRSLADHYRLARGTVVTAFENLKAEGYVNATVGSGTYVACELPESLLVATRSDARTPSRPPEPPPPRRLASLARRSSLLGGYPPGPPRAFRTGQPALDLFPTSVWAQVAASRLRRASARDLLACGPLGLDALREAVAAYLIGSRGVRCTSAQVAIVSGTLDAAHTVARLLLEPGDRVAVEHPGYAGVRLSLEAVGGRIVDVPVDDEGLVVSAKRLAGVRMVVVTPAHQYPLGMSMSVTRRLALLEWARSTGATVFEDDYDSEFRFCGPPMPAMQGLDTHGRVVFSGSFSKVMFPSLRLAYVVLPEDLVAPFAAVQSLSQRHAPVLDQAVLAEFITGGHFGRHIRRMRAVYAERLAVLLSGAKAELAGLLDVCSIEAGLQTVGWLKRGIAAEAASRAAAGRDVEAAALVLPARDGRVQQVLHLGFAAVDARELRRGIEVLAEVLGRLARRR